MLQALLIERFGLKYHFETREERVYWLVRSGKRLKMTPARDTTIVPFMTVRTFHGGVETARWWERIPPWPIRHSS